MEKSWQMYRCTDSGWKLSRWSSLKKCLLSSQPNVVLVLRWNSERTRHTSLQVAVILDSEWKKKTTTGNRSFLPGIIFYPCSPTCRYSRSNSDVVLVSVTLRYWQSCLVSQYTLRSLSKQRQCVVTTQIQIIYGWK